MVPSGIVGYFAATSAAAGALIGLLFVAVSLRPESIFGPNAAPKARRLAESSFTGLVNSFFLSLVALIPQTNIGYPAAILAALSFYITLTRQLRKEKASQLTVLLSTFAIYLLQFGLGIAAIVQPSNVNLVYLIGYVVIAALSVALSRAWTLLSGQA
jgi:Na+/citrate or Na+/malate symporter